MSEEIAYESRDTWFFKKHGCFPGCAGPLSLLLVALACLLLQAANVKQAFGDAVGRGHVPSFTGTLSAEAPLGDSRFLSPGPYVFLERAPETFSWRQVETRKAGRADRDDSREVATTYSYETEWTFSPDDSRAFREPKGHQNPPATEHATLWAPGLALGGRPVVGRVETRGEAFVPKPAQLASGAQIEGEFVYVGKGTLAKPQVGDVRVRYRALHAGQEATFFGDVASKTLRPLPTADGPHAALRAGPRELAAQRVYVDLGTSAWQTRCFAWLFAWIGVYAAVSALVIWTQRSASVVFRDGVYRVLGFVTVFGVLGFLACVDLILRLGAPAEAVTLGAVLFTAVGLFVFGRWARSAREAVQGSFWLRLLLGDMSGEDD